ncbi:dTDP-glucose 4,6-dehydratase [Luminiphilus syltensis NOR5-1B]|uniref:dTDP-glucose 4,6-dehydratase n=2 Tax=Luminiphilus TaxID=1341118 RepID=B8KUL1_9GAMM|nr:dTDP-glucose 4,6-dehydratase [Luminiphilus syltensis NOR5-1B]
MVTGAAGFIGANFVHYWAEKYPGDTLIAYDALTYAGNRNSLTELEDAGKLVFVQGDICDPDCVSQTLRDHSVDTLVHFAAESHVDRSITGPDAFIRTNLVGTHTLLAAAREFWLSGSGLPHRFHHVSTDEVFGSLTAEAPAFREDLRYEPNSPYSASKAGSDHLVRAYHHTYGLEVTTSNCSNNYGPYHFPEKLIPLCLTNILDGKPLPVYGDGSNIRDWLYVVDHARGVDAVLSSGEVGETYNIGGINEWRNIDIVELLCEQMDQLFSERPELARRFPHSPCSRGESAASLITFVEDRAGHDWRYAIDAGKIGRELGFVPEETFATGLKKTLHWYVENEPWWRPLLIRR